MRITNNAVSILVFSTAMHICCQLLW